MKKIIYCLYVTIFSTALLLVTMHFTSKVSYVEYETLPTPSSTQTEIEEGFSPSVCVTKSGKKYHKSDCEWVKGRTVIRYTKNEAIRMGYEPCSACKP